jgi:hypothetical protein
MWLYSSLAGFLRSLWEEEGAATIECDYEYRQVRPPARLSSAKAAERTAADPPPVPHLRRDC